MKNAHGIFTGATGSGKTTLVREFILPELPRYLILDQEGSYRAHHETRDPEQLAKWFLLHGDSEEFRVSYMGDHEPGYLAAMAMAYESQSSRDAPPLAVVVDEAHLWSSSRQLPREYGLLVRAGRKHGIAVLSITQRDVDLHRDIRVNSALRVAFYQDSGFSSDFERSWFADRLEDVGSLELPPDRKKAKRPEYGRHYLTDPPDVDPVEYYRKALT